MGRCPSREKLLAFLAGGEVEEKVRAHVRECARCREAAASLSGVLHFAALLQENSSVAGSAATMPPGMAERIFDKVNADWEQRHDAAGGGIRIRSLAVMFTDMAGSTEFAEKH